MRQETYVAAAVPPPVLRALTHCQCHACQIKVLEDQLRAYREGADDRDDQIERLLTRNVELQEQVDRLDGQLYDVSCDLSKAQNDLLVAKRTIAELQADKDDAEEEIAFLKDWARRAMNDERCNGSDCERSWCNVGRHIRDKARRERREKHGNVAA